MMPAKQVTLSPRPLQVEDPELLEAFSNLCSLLHDKGYTVVATVMKEGRSLGNISLAKGTNIGEAITQIIRDHYAMQREKDSPLPNGYDNPDLIED